MKRTMLAAALCVVLSSPAIAADSPRLAPPSAVTFDQVNIVAMSPYSSTSADFAREAAELSAPGDTKQATFTFPMKTLRRFAYYRDLSRVETPAAHLVVITRPGEIDMLNTLTKTYKKTSGVALATLSMLDGGLAFPMIPARPATTMPGTMDISIAFDGSTLDSQTIASQASGFQRATNSNRKDLAEPNRSDANLSDLSPIATLVGCQAGSIWVNSGGCARF